ncbi:MAG TPA: ATP-binding protein [Thermoanaerobaculia bacterium]|nr:ATP-binding protein [Thermoanaerobaculia bacterium]
MAGPNPFSWRKADLIWGLVSLVTLIASLYYPHASNQLKLPFSINPNTWKVISSGSVTLPDLDPEHWPQVGDRLLSIDGITFEQFRDDRSVQINKALLEADGALVRLERGGEIRTIQVHARPPGASFWDRVPVGAFFPLIFWLMGTITVLFLRPYDERWYVLVLFSFTTAVWVATGMASSSRVAGSGVVYHFLIWFFLPLAAHLHMILPDALMEARHKLLVPVYGVSLVLAVLDYFHLLLGFEHVLWFVAGLLASLGLLLLRLFLPVTPAVKVANRIMLFGVALGFGPILVFWVVIPFFFPPGGFSVANYALFYPWIMVISVIAMPILPMSYLYVIYKHHLGALEFRANRLLGAYSFASLYITAYAVLLFAVNKIVAPMSDRSLQAVFVASLIFLSGAQILRGRFQSFLDRHVFGIRHSTEEVIGMVSERIPKVFDREMLARVVEKEILPSLLIRQSALYVFNGASYETLYEQALPGMDPATASMISYMVVPGGPPPPPSVEELRGLLARSHRYLPPENSGPRSWVRLVIPLSVQEEAVGVWLMGRRDPDDHYPVSDIHLLTTVANQIAPMLENIRLYEQAQQEIAQRKAAEMAIRRSEERFRTLFEATLEGIAIVRNGTILEVNQALLAIFGYEPGELRGRRLSDLVADDEEDITLTGFLRESVGRRRDGSTVDIEVAGKSYVFEGEDVTVVAIRDIARRREIEEERETLQRQLLVSQKMEAIGRLSAGVAHDFNNCLLAIFGYSDLLIDRYSDDPFLRRNLTGIKEAGQKAAALTKQLLAFARRQPMETRVMDLNLVVSGLEKMLQRLLGEDVQLVTELHPRLARVKIDPGQIEQVIMNLAVNARHAMPSGGRLTVRTQPVEVTEDAAAPVEIRPEARPEARPAVPVGSHVLLTVTDTGIGMDPETQARIFEPFFSTKGDGTGLGLSTAYGIVRQSNGQIFVDSAPGQGATFSIYLPATREAEAAGAGAAPLTNLLVEDEDEVRAVLRQILTGKGYRVLQASSGEEALAMSRIHRGAIDLLLTDVTMPNMKGPELASRLLQDRPRTRVLFISGYNEESFDENSGGYLQKPFSPQRLAATVRAILDASAADEEPGEPPVRAAAV